MMPTTTVPETVVLRSGIVAPVDALRLLWRLEAAGFQVRLDGADLVVSPGSRLTHGDRAAIRDYKGPLVALVRDCDEVIT